jgi:4-hydroxy-tetrahydrodipicolinate reductase
MKIAVVGIGKTGSKIRDLLAAEGILYGAYDVEIMEKPEVLKDADASIAFIPGNGAESIIPVLLDSKKPVIWGGTGYTFPEDFNDKLIEMGIPWIYGSNYSLGMQIALDMLKVMGERLSILNNPDISLHEIHHIHKKDAPSGTALTWEKILDRDIDISSERIGDVVGTHQLTVSTATESIYFEHKALDRGIFADGAVWACKQILNNLNNYKGLIPFSELFHKNIKV